MILLAAAAALLSFSVSVIVIYGFKALSPGGVLGQKKEVSRRIFENSIRNLSPEFVNLLKRDHLSDIQGLERLLKQQKFTPHLSLLLKRSGFKYSLGSFLLIILSLTTVVFSVGRAFLPFPAVLALTIACMGIPFFILNQKNKKYLALFSEHLPDITSIVSNGLRVGQSIEMAVGTVSKSAPYPVNIEFQVVVSEVKLGLSLDAALKNLYERIGSAELKIFVTGIIIQQELGGNLSEILGNLEKTIRERFALQREIKVLSAQGVTSMWVLGGMPFAFALIWIMGDRALFMEYINSDMGKILIVFSLVMQTIAFLWMKKIVAIED